MPEQEHVESKVPRLGLLLSYLGFVSLGLPDTVLGAAWPALRAELGLPLAAAGGALLLTTAGVVASSSLYGALSSRTHPAAVLVGSTVLAATALLTIAFSSRWNAMLLVSFVGGLGGGAIDAALNAHAARNYSARHMTWMHGFWGVGAALAPAFVATALRLGASFRAAYGAIGLLELLLAFTFLQTRQLWRDGRGSADAHAVVSASARLASRWPMRASLLMFYCYGGLEAGVGLWSASLLVGTHAVSPAVGSSITSLYWAALTLGRFAIGARADALGPVRVLSAASLIALGASCVAALPGIPTWLMALALFVLGFALAPIYPLTMHDTPTRFGPYWGSKLVGQQIAATTVGVATLPWLIGVLAERASLASVPLFFALLALGVLAFGRARLKSSLTPA